MVNQPPIATLRMPRDFGVTCIQSHKMAHMNMKRFRHTRNILAAHTDKTIAAAAMTTTKAFKIL